MFPARGLTAPRQPCPAGWLMPVLESPHGVTDQLVSRRVLSERVVQLSSDEVLLVI